MFAQTSLHFFRLNLLWFVLIHCTVSLSQNHKTEGWIAYIGNYKINEQWRFWHDYHFVNNAFFAIRPGMTFVAPRDYHISGGYAFLGTATPASSRINRLEHRLWWQVNKNIRLSSRLTYRVRYRYDGRFRERLDLTGNVGDGFGFNNRHRFMQSFRFVLSRNDNGGFWHLDLMNEVLYNTGQQIQNGTDQIRTYLLLGYSTPKLTILTGYHQRYFPPRNGQWGMNHGLTLWFIHSKGKKDLREMEGG
jgi:hypothetical protein